MKLKRFSFFVTMLFLFGSNVALGQDGTFVKSHYTLLSDGNAEILFDVDIQPGWYMYSTKAISNGPMPTSFEVTPSESFELVGKTEDALPSKLKFDEAFGMDVYVFENEGRFKQIIRPLTDKPFSISGTLVYQTCNGAECLMNEVDITLNLKFSGEVKQAEPAQENNNSLWGFFIVAFLAGLGGIITPCVFPMIPMTVSFLIGGASKRGGIIKGLIFGLSVTLIYTALGLIVSLFQSTAATDTLGTHWIPNLIFAVLFLVFAISFFGAFEITLPSGLANRADRKADKGGYIGAFFVAFAMVIVSFSCTGPFVGSILAAAVVGGVSLKPILGMATFGIAFSLPFVIFSFFPSIMKKMPKSGGWLNVVKVIFAFVLLGFAIKFLYNVDAAFGLGIITRAGFLAIWVSLLFLLGLYFLGIIRTKHDNEVSGLGWGRIFAAIASFAFAFYMLTGLFGAPLKSISGLIPPPDGSTLSISNNSASTSSSTSGSGFSSLSSVPSIDEAIALSKKENKPIFLYFTSQTCGVCKVMEATVLNNAGILSLLENDFIIAKLYVDNKTPDQEHKTLGRKLRSYQTAKFGSASQPLYAIIDAQEKILSGPIGSSSVDEFSSFLEMN